MCSRWPISYVYVLYIMWLIETIRVKFVRFWSVVKLQYRRVFIDFCYTPPLPNNKKPFPHTIGSAVHSVCGTLFGQCRHSGVWRTCFVRVRDNGPLSLLVNTHTHQNTHTHTSTDEHTHTTVTLLRTELDHVYTVWSDWKRERKK